MNITFQVISFPNFKKNPDATRTASGGTFQTYQRLERDLFKQLNPRFISREEDEDGVGVAGWNYDIKSLTTAIRAGHTITIESVTCATIRELFDLLESLPARRATQQQSASQRKERIAELKQYIVEHGEKPAGDNYAKGERVLDTSDIYGTGSWFVISANEIWFVKNNGMDGDDWSKNNVVTGGAGAIGYRIAFDAAIADELRSLGAKK